MGTEPKAPEIVRAWVPQHTCWRLRGSECWCWGPTASPPLPRTPGFHPLLRAGKWLAEGTARPVPLEDPGFPSAVVLSLGALSFCFGDESGDKASGSAS